MQESRGHLSRDHYLTTKDVYNIAQSLSGLDWKYSPDQAESLRCFASHRPEYVLHYQPLKSSIGQPFEMVFSKPGLIALLVKYGHGRPVMMDSTFGTNNLKVMSC